MKKRICLLIIFLISQNLIFGQPTEAQRVKQLFDSIYQYYQTNDKELALRIANSSLEYNFWSEAIISRASGYPTDGLIKQRTVSLLWLFYNVSDASEEHKIVFNRLVELNKELNRESLIASAAPPSKSVISFWELLGKANIKEEEKVFCLKQLFDIGKFRQNRIDIQMERCFWKQAIIEGSSVTGYLFTGMIAARLETMARFLLLSKDHPDFSGEHNQLLGRLMRLQYKHRIVRNISVLDDL